MCILWVKEALWNFTNFIQQVKKIFGHGAGVCRCNYGCVANSRMILTPIISVTFLVIPPGKGEKEPERWQCNHERMTNNRQQLEIFSISVSYWPSLIKIVQIRVKSSPVLARKESPWKSILGKKIENLSFLSGIRIQPKNMFLVEQLILFWLGDNFKTQASQRKHFNLTQRIFGFYSFIYIRVIQELNILNSQIQAFHLEKYLSKRLGCLNLSNFPKHTFPKYMTHL